MVRRGADLALVLACSLGLIATILAFPFAQTVRIALGVPFVLFFPGYTLLAALFPRGDDLDATDRIPLSFGLSIAAVPLILLVVNYTPWGLQLNAVLASVSLFIVIAAAVALARRWMLPRDDAFGIDIPSSWRGSAGVGVANGLWVLAIVPVVVTVGIVGYLVSGASGGEGGFTEFYVLGSNGLAESYPERIKVGERATLTLGVVNHEGEDEDYRTEVWIDGTNGAGISNLTLADSQVWERTISLIPTYAGENQMVEFLLYRTGGAEPYRRLHLWLDVEPIVSRPIRTTAPRITPTPALSPSPTPVPIPTPEPPVSAEALGEEQAPAQRSDGAEGSEAPQLRVHIVVPGQYLLLIAGLYEVPLADIIAANDVEDPNLIYPQQEILIPARSGAGESE